MDAVKRSRLIAGDGTPARAWREDPGLARVRPIEAGELAPAGTRVVVVAPHPDDEVLAAGGLLQLLARRGHPLLLVAVTDGEGSHAGSPEWPPGRLAAVRPRETIEALACLGLAGSEPYRLGIPDGGVAAAEDALVVRLAALLAPGDVIVTTWRYDGHPDHEATARACLAAAQQQGARVLEVPVWGWHWSAPGDGAIPLDRAHRLMLAPDLVDNKRAALACFRSQVHPDPSTGAAAILFPAAVERMLNPWELYVHDA